MAADDQPGDRRTARPGRRRDRMVADRPEGGHAAAHQMMSCACRDDPGVDDGAVPPELQQIRGPCPIAAGVAVPAAGLRLRRQPEAACSPGWRQMLGERR